MKYAVIVLVACYLLVWGCGPDTSKKADEPTSHVTESKVEKTPAPVASAEAPAPAPLPEEPAVAVVEQVAEQPPLDADAVVEPAAPAPPVHDHAAAQKMAVVQPPPDLPETEMESLVTLPCGMVVPRESIPADAPCLRAKKVPCPMMYGRPHPPVDGMMVMPCYRPCFRQPVLPMDHPDLDDPERGHHPEPLTDTDDELSQDLAEAMQKMVETTNDMVEVTRQLMVATQEMVRATQDAAFHVQQPQAAPPVEEKHEPTRDDTTAALHEAVLATQKALETLNQVLPRVLEPRQ
jgi:hypothetical protein